MDITQFASALLAIVVIDIVLAGDNAIVIALAARSLPPALHKRAIVWGAVGAIAVRSLMTLLVVWLLQIPGLLLVGGVLLVWIGAKLLRPDDGAGHADATAATTFWGAMRTIVIADAVMGLDNVLAVAGAAHGSYLLVVAGLVISVPIVVWGSTLVLKVVERWPGVVYIGAGVLLWTAAKMIVSEPLLAPFIARAPALGALVWVLIPVVLWAAFVRNHRRLASRIHARLAEFQPRRPAAAGTDGRVAVDTVATPAAAPAASAAAPAPATSSAAAAAQEPASATRAPLKVLVPVDRSKNSRRALDHVVAEYRRHHELEVHLLNVQPRLSRHAARFLSGSDRESWHHAQADAALAPAQALLDRAGVPHTGHWAVGDRADEICRAARRWQVHHIVLGTARKNSITRMLEDSTTGKVLEATPVPVEVVAGEAISKWERWGLPAGVIGAGWLMYVGMK